MSSPARAVIDLEAPACPVDVLAQTGAGTGRLAVARVDGQSAVVACAAASPLHLFTPRPRGAAVWAVATTHGGGVLAGDHIDLEVDVGLGAGAIVATQSNTRVYRSSGALATQRLRASIASAAALAVLPEPTAPFAGSRYQQEQRFALEPGGSLLFVDAVTEGRGARGERWAFDSYASRLEVEVGGRLVLADAIRLLAGEGAAPVDRMEGVAMMATVVALGPALAGGARRILAERSSAAAEPAAQVLAAASPIADGIHLRMAASSIAAGLAYIRATLAFAAPLFGGAPFDHRP